MHFRTEASVPWNVDQWWSKSVSDDNMQRADGSRGAVSPHFKLLNPIKREARNKFYVFSVFSLCESNYRDWHKHCIKSWVKKKCCSGGRALVHRVLSLVHGKWLRGFREPQSLSNTLTPLYLLSASWSSLERPWIPRWKLSHGKKAQILISSITYVTVACLQSFSKLGSFFARSYEPRRVLLVIIREIAFM